MGDFWAKESCRLWRPSGLLPSLHFRLCYVIRTSHLKTATTRKFRAVKNEKYNKCTARAQKALIALCISIITTNVVSSNSYNSEEMCCDSSFRIVIETFGFNE